MWSQQIFVALLSVFVTLQHVAAVVNNHQNKNTEESPKATSENKENEKVNSDAGDLVAESSESANRRETPAILETYGTPSLPSGINGHINLPVPVYGVPNAPSNNVVYPAPPPDVPPPPPKISPGSLYGTPSLGKTYGVPQLPPISKGYGAPIPLKYGTPSFSYNQFSVNLSPPKSIYGPPKSVYGPPGKPLKFHKYPSKNIGFRPPKPVYGTPITFKDNNFNYNKINSNYVNSNSFNKFYTSTSLSSVPIVTNSLSNLYSGISTTSHQYGAPILPPKIQYTGHTIGISAQYGAPEKNTISGTSLVAYGPPQPSSNPKPPHPGAPAPPTPPDIKYDGWQPIPGLVSKRPVDELHHLTGEGSGYHGLSPPPLNTHSQISTSYGTPTVTLDISGGNSLLGQSGLSDSYGVPLNSITGPKGVSDSYSAPLGTVTGSGGIVASSGEEAHSAGSHSSSHSNSHNLNLDLSSVGINHGGPSIQISDTYGVPQASHSSSHVASSFGSSSHSSFGTQGHETSLISSSDIGLVPPSGVYESPPSSQYGPPLHSNTINNYKSPSRPGLYSNVGKSIYNKEISSFGRPLGGNSYLPPLPPSGSYGVPSNAGAISFQNVVHGSSTAGIDLEHSVLNIEGANALPLTSYTVPLGSIDGSYTLPETSGDVSVSLDFSHPPVSIDLTDSKQISLPQDCYNKQHIQVPSLAYGVPSADSYTSSLSSLTTNIANSQIKTIVPQSSYGAPQAQITVPSSEYGVPDLLHSSSIKTEAKVNSLEENEETHGKDYGKSVAASFGPNSELVESHSIDLNNIPLQGNLGSYTLQIQSADGAPGQVPHTQVLNEGLLQSILQAIEQPGKDGQNAKYPIILQPSVERNNYSVNETVNNLDESQQQASEIREIIVEAPKDSKIDNKNESSDNEETLQLLDTSNIALYYRKDDDAKKTDDEVKSNDVNNVEESN